MKSRFLVAIWFVTGLMWTVFGLLHLFRLHQRLFGMSFLVLAALAFFLAMRVNKKSLKKPHEV